MTSKLIKSLYTLLECLLFSKLLALVSTWVPDSVTHITFEFPLLKVSGMMPLMTPLIQMGPFYYWGKYIQHSTSRIIHDISKLSVVAVGLINILLYLSIIILLYLLSQEKVKSRMKGMAELATQQDINIQITPYFQAQNDNNLMCGLHAVNNILGQQYCTRDSFQKICDQLEHQHSQQNTNNKPQPQSYRHWCGCIGGNYHANVLEIALGKAGYGWEQVKEYNKLTVEVLEKDKELGIPVGFLLNVQKNVSCVRKIVNKVLCISEKHWCCIRRFQKSYFLLDSLFDQPLNFQSINQVLNFVQLQLHQGADIVLIRKLEKKKEKIIV